MRQHVQTTRSPFVYVCKLWVISTLCLKNLTLLIFHHLKLLKAGGNVNNCINIFKRRVQWSVLYLFDWNIQMVNIAIFLPNLCRVLSNPRENTPLHIYTHINAIKTLWYHYVHHNQQFHCFDQFWRTKHVPYIKVRTFMELRISP